MSTEILDLMKDRKYHKGKPTYREIDELIKRKCKDAQEAWHNDKCAGIESLAKSKNHCLMYEKIKHFMTEKNVSPGSCIKMNMVTSFLRPMKSSTGGLNM